MAKRYQRGNQNPYIEEEQTTQWPKYTKGVIIICISKRSRRSNGQNIPKVVSSALLRNTDSDYPFGIFWPLCRLLFFDIQILITLWYLVAIVSSVLESVFRRRADETMVKRYQSVNQNLYIKEELTTQWPNDTKGVIGIRISKKN
jgi:hypothetical protein